MVPIMSIYYANILFPVWKTLSHQAWVYAVRGLYANHQLVWLGSWVSSCWPKTSGTFLQLLNKSSPQKPQHMTFKAVNAKYLIY